MMNRGAPPNDRWRRAFTFDETVLQEVYRDTRATLPAVLTVFAVMGAVSLGGYLWWAVVEDFPDKTDFLIDSVLIGTLVAGALYLVWAGLLALLSGAVARQDQGAISAIIRTHGFAAVPFGVATLIFIPGLESTISIVAFGLLLLSTTLAARASLGGPLPRALGANLAGFFLWLLVMTQLADSSAFYAPAPFILFS